MGRRNSRPRQGVSAGPFEGEDLQTGRLAKTGEVFCRSHAAKMHEHEGLFGKMKSEGHEVRQ